MAHRHDKNNCHDNGDGDINNSKWIHTVIYYFSILMLITKQPVAVNAPRINTGEVINAGLVGTRKPRTVETKRILDISDKYFDIAISGLY